MQIMLHRYVHFHSSERHAVRHHLPWFVVPDTACWTCKRQYGSRGQLKNHVDEERIKSDLDPHVDQEPHQMLGQEHVVEWCELGFGYVQQVADQTVNESLDGLLDWVKVCLTNKSEVKLHMLDRELLSAFSVFLGNLPRKEELSSLIQSCKFWQQRDRRSERSLAKHLIESRFGTLQVFFRLCRRCMMDTITWTAGSLKSERERPGSVW